MARTVTAEKFTPNVQMGIIVVVIVLMFLFFGISGSGLIQHITFYLLMFLGAIVGAIIVYGKDAGDKLHFTTYNLPVFNVVLYGIVIGLMLALVENFSTGNTMFVYQSVETSSILGFGDIGLISLVVFALIFSLITAFGEETLTRGFLNSIAENFADSKMSKNISKYFLIPLIFTMLHFFMWNRLEGVILSAFVILFLLMYHFTFAIVCQFSMDVTASIYTPIAIHMVYNAIKLLMMLQAQGAF